MYQGSVIPLYLKTKCEKRLKRICASDYRTKFPSSRRPAAKPALLHIFFGRRTTTSSPRALTRGPLIGDGDQMWTPGQGPGRQKVGRCLVKNDVEKRSATKQACPRGPGCASALDPADKPRDDENKEVLSGSLISIDAPSHKIFAERMTTSINLQSVAARPRTRDKTVWPICEAS